MGLKTSIFYIVTITVLLSTIQSVFSDDSLDDSHYLSMIADRMSEMFEEQSNDREKRGASTKEYAEEEPALKELVKREALRMTTKKALKREAGSMWPHHGSKWPHHGTKKIVKRIAATKDYAEGEPASRELVKREALRKTPKRVLKREAGSMRPHHHSTKKIGKRMARSQPPPSPHTTKKMGKRMAATKDYAEVEAASKEFVKREAASLPAKISKIEKRRVTHTTKKFFKRGAPTKEYAEEEPALKELVKREALRMTTKKALKREAGSMWPHHSTHHHSTKKMGKRMAATKDYAEEEPALKELVKREALRITTKKTLKREAGSMWLHHGSKWPHHGTKKIVKRMAATKDYAEEELALKELVKREAHRKTTKKPHKRMASSKWPHHSSKWPHHSTKKVGKRMAATKDYADEVAAFGDF